MVTGGQASPVFDAVEAALDDVAAAVAVGIEADSPAFGTRFVSSKLVEIRLKSWLLALSRCPSSGDF